ncbi:hypothetical protein CKG00_00490 [Morganella morganii]|uniref:DUF721 domain-containing protein n=1 Tax=Morganella morganii TaxID=582 RepID=A0A433ZSE9_MORMO|nr:DciA family protein [Morganella morganii]RUT65041.1 hypothetical protein CKG00_00490 [Morganella morganii]
MRDSQPVSLESLLESGTRDNNTLKSIQQRAVVLLKLNRAVLALLPAMLKPHCRVANYRKQLLILEVSNAAQMTRLRYELPALRSALRREILPSLSSIDIKINPSLMKSSSTGLPGGDKNSNSAIRGQKTAEPGRKLSAESANALKALAQRSPEKLRKKLEKLAALAGESTSAAD